MGAGLPAIAADQKPYSYLVHRHRGQARPPQGTRRVEDFAQNIDLERYSHQPDRLKDPRQQLSRNQASNDNFPRHTPQNSQIDYRLSAGKVLEN